MQLTLEQERQLQAVAETGAYGSAQEVLDAAISIVSAVTSEARFESGSEALENLMLAGLASEELSSEKFWESVDGETDTLLRKSGKSPA